MKRVYYFVILTILNFIFGITSNKLLNSNKLLVDSLIEQFPTDQVQELLTFQQKWE